MKMRKVILTLEVVTDIPLKLLRNAKCYEIYNGGQMDPIDVLQAQANVVEPGEERGRI
jgi:hypothetical protein